MAHQQLGRNLALVALTATLALSSVWGCVVRPLRPANTAGHYVQMQQPAARPIVVRQVAPVVVAQPQRVVVARPVTVFVPPPRRVFVPQHHPVIVHRPQPVVYPVRYSAITHAHQCVPGTLRQCHGQTYCGRGGVQYCYPSGLSWGACVETY